MCSSCECLCHGAIVLIFTLSYLRFLLLNIPCCKYHRQHKTFFSPTSVADKTCSMITMLNNCDKKLLDVLTKLLQWPFEQLRWENEYIYFKCQSHDPHRRKYVEEHKSTSQMWICNMFNFTLPAVSLSTFYQIKNVHLKNCCLAKAALMWGHNSRGWLNINLIRLGSLLAWKFSGTKPLPQQY